MGVASLCRRLPPAKTGNLFENENENENVFITLFSHIRDTSSIDPTSLLLFHHSCKPPVLSMHPYLFSHGKYSTSVLLSPFLRYLTYQFVIWIIKGTALVPRRAPGYFYTLRIIATHVANL